jgi:hypothetical protein
MPRACDNAQDMSVPRLAAAASGAEVAAALDSAGCAIVERLAPPEVIERVSDELQPWLAATRYGQDQFSGLRTRRTGGLLARSPTCRDLIQHPTVLEAVRGVLAQATSFHIHLTQLIAIDPGELAQLIHRDQWAFDFFPFPNGYEVTCNTIWALNDFSEANGATRVIPGSHGREDRLTFEQADTEPAEMSAGSVLLYTGALYHGAGANRSDSVRCGLNLTYTVSWLRQEENQYLAVPHDVARAFPESLLRLMGYARGAYALGYVDDLRDPLDALFGRTDRSARLGEPDKAAERFRAEG